MNDVIRPHQVAPSGTRHFLNDLYPEIAHAFHKLAPRPEGMPDDFRYDDPLVILPSQSLVKVIKATPSSHKEGEHDLAIRMFRMDPRRSRLVLNGEYEQRFLHVAGDSWRLFVPYDPIDQSSANVFPWIPLQAYAFCFVGEEQCMLFAYCLYEWGLLPQSENDGEMGPPSEKKRLSLAE